MTKPPSSARFVSRVRGLIRRTGIGALCYRFVYSSFSGLRWKLNFGWGGALRYAWGEAAMKRAARRLTPVVADAADGLPCTFMTGCRYWHQTVFCAHSLAHQCANGLRVTIYDDGSLTPGQQRILRTVLSGVTLVSHAESTARLDKHLSPSRYPLLRALRDTMPMMRKLVDLHAGGSGWQLYLDSDMLFQRPPIFLIHCAERRACCYMQDRVHGYTLPEAELSRISGLHVPPRVNAGIVAIDDSRIDWDAVERWLNAFPPAALDPQLLEQTLTAMLLGAQNSGPAPGDSYHILYDSSSPPPDNAVLLHFIFHAKYRYFTTDWRRYFTRSQA